MCAAIRAKDGDVLLGIRHYSEDMYKQIHVRPDGDKFYSLRGENQGFVDQYGTYMTREQAYKVAKKAGQVNHNDSILYSEDLY